MRHLTPSLVAALAIALLTSCASAPPQPDPAPVEDAAAVEASPEAGSDPAEAATEAPPAEEAPPAAQMVPVSPWLEEAMASAEADELGTSNLLVFAVKHGAWVDGMPQAVAKDLADETHGRVFVPKCKICRQTEAGLQEYAEAEVTLEAEFDPELQATLTGEDDKARRDAFQALVGRWVVAAMKALPLSEAKRREIAQDIQSRAKQGMSGLPSDFKTCPSCEGAQVFL